MTDPVARALRTTAGLLDRLTATLERAALRRDPPTPAPFATATLRVDGADLARALEAILAGSDARRALDDVAAARHRAVVESFGPTPPGWTPHWSGLRVVPDA